MQVAPTPTTPATEIAEIPPTVIAVPGTAASGVDQPAGSAPDAATSIETPPASPAELPAGVERSRTEPWAKLVADPGHTPELLALAAVQTLGPRAYDWAQRVRESYPTATAHGIARLAARQFSRFGSVSTLFAAISGSYAPVALIGSAALTNAELILHIAAAYDLDPRSRDRATDLLVLTLVHPTREAAEAALRSAEQPVYEDEDSGIVDAAWRLGRMAAAQATGWTAVRALNHFLPGSALIAAGLTGRSSAQTVAARATAFYRAAAS